jgi:hypothetical protein
VGPCLDLKDDKSRVFASRKNVNLPQVPTFLLENASSKGPATVWAEGPEVKRKKLLPKKSDVKKRAN